MVTICRYNPEFLSLLGSYQKMVKDHRQIPGVRASIFKQFILSGGEVKAA
jgi:hypothetical protein